MTEAVAVAGGLDADMVLVVVVVPVLRPLQVPLAALLCLALGVDIGKSMRGETYCPLMWLQNTMQIHPCTLQNLQCLLTMQWMLFGQHLNMLVSQPLHIMRMAAHQTWVKVRKGCLVMQFILTPLQKLPFKASLSCLSVQVRSWAFVCHSHFCR